MSKKSSNHRIVLGLKNGTAVFAQDGNDWHDIFRGLTGCHVTSLACQGEMIFAGTTDGMHATPELGKPWRQRNSGLTARHVRSVAFHPKIEGLAVAGTEPTAVLE